MNGSSSFRIALAILLGTTAQAQVTQRVSVATNEAPSNGASYSNAIPAGRVTWSF